mgnify:CR=1 FL=1
MLIEFLILMIEKGFIKNSQKLAMFTDLYEEIKGKNTLETIEVSQNISGNNTNLSAQGKGNETTNEENKFHKKKFIKLLKEVSKKIYPGDQNAFETIIYEKIAGLEHEEQRLKIDESIKKILTFDTIKTLQES